MVKKLEGWEKKEPLRSWEVDYLRCRICGRANIPWRRGEVGCPPRVCKACRKEGLGIYDRKW